MTSQVGQSVYTPSGFVPAFGLCIDWETTGSNFGGDSSIEYQGIALGAAVFSLKTFEIKSTFKIYIKFDPTKYKWTDKAQEIHGITKEFLEENGVTQEEAAIEFASFLLDHFGPSPKIMVLGHNIHFDIAFTKQLLEPFELMFTIHHVQLDTACAGLIAIGQYKSDFLFDIFGLPKRGDHDPLEDVKYTLAVAKGIRELCGCYVS